MHSKIGILIIYSKSILINKYCMLQKKCSHRRMKQTFETGCREAVKYIIYPQLGRQKKATVAFLRSLNIL